LKGFCRFERGLNLEMKIEMQLATNRLNAVIIKQIGLKCDGKIFPPFPPFASDMVVKVCKRTGTMLYLLQLNEYKKHHIIFCG